MNYPFCIILNILIYNSLSLYYLFPLFGNKSRKDNGYVLTWFFLLFLCLYSLYSGDWLHYREKLDFYEMYSFSGLEPVYDMILFQIEGRYILFRFIVWGIALLLLRTLFHRLAINSFRMLGFFVIWGILFFAYARVSLGLSLLFYGYSFWVKPTHKMRFIGYLWGTVCVFSSIFCHKSLVVLVLLLPFTLIYLYRKRFLFYCCCCIILLFIFNNLILPYIDIYLSQLDGTEYFSAESYARPFGKKIVDASVRSPLFILMAYLVYELVWKKKQKEFSWEIQRYFVFVILIFLTSLTLFFSDIKSQVLFYRVLYMIFIPFAIILSEAYFIVSRRVLLLCSLMAYLGGNMWLAYSFLGHLNGTIQ